MNSVQERQRMEKLGNDDSCESLWSSTVQYIFIYELDN